MTFGVEVSALKNISGRRLHSVQHNRAQWYSGCLANKVVTSLGCYPLQFRLDGAVVKGIAIGAVHTLAEFRGNGFAPQLIRYVEENQRSYGAAISRLYSDIGPDYYARQGYQICPAWQGWIDVDSVLPAVAGNRRRLKRISPWGEFLGTIQRGHV